MGTYFTLQERPAKGGSAMPKSRHHTLSNERQTGRPIDSDRTLESFLTRATSAISQGDCENYIERPMGVKETAVFLGMSVASLYKATHKGAIPHYKPNGGKLYFFRCDLIAWIASGRVAAWEELEVAALGFRRGQHHGK